MLYIKQKRNLNQMKTAALPAYKNILILNLRKIGDTIMATSAAYLLKKAYPDAQITMLVKPLTRSIVENNPVIDEVLLYNYSHKNKLKDLRKTAKLLHDKSFDLAIVIDNKPRSALLAWMAKIPKRVGFEKITRRNIYLKLLYTNIYKIDYDFLATPQVKNHEIFINRLTGRNDKAKMVMPNISTKSRIKVNELISSLPAKKIKIALCIRSGVPFKDWPQKYFAEVIQKLNTKYDAAFFLIGSDNDSAYADEFVKLCPNISVRNFCGKTTLPELGHLLKKSDLLLSVDTGTAHMAAAVDTPEVVIFAGTSHKHWSPYGDKVSCVYPEGLTCYPCSDEIRKTCRDYKCLYAIQPIEIQNKCMQILDNIRKERSI